MLNEEELNGDKEYEFHLTFTRDDGATIDSPIKIKCTMAKAMNLLGIFDEAVEQARAKRHIKEQLEDISWGNHED